MFYKKITSRRQLDVLTEMFIGFEMKSTLLYVNMCVMDARRKHSFSQIDK